MNCGEDISPTAEGKLIPFMEVRSMDTVDAGKDVFSVSSHQGLLACLALTEYCRIWKGVPGIIFTEMGRFVALRN